MAAALEREHSPEETLEWYEVLLANQDDWEPREEDIRASSFEAAELYIPAAEFAANDTLFDLMVHLKTPKLNGMRRELRVFDIIHLCKAVRGKADQFRVADFLLVPRARVRPFLPLLPEGRSFFADYRWPDLCMIQLREEVSRARGFAESFCREIK
jgi:hypothetical protein